MSQTLYYTVGQKMLNQWSEGDNTMVISRSIRDNIDIHQLVALKIDIFNIDHLSAIIVRNRQLIEIYVEKYAWQCPIADAERSNYVKVTNLTHNKEVMLADRNLALAVKRALVLIK